MVSCECGAPFCRHRPPRVRLDMGLDAAAYLSSWLLGNREGAAGDRVMDQLWLSVVLVERRRCLLVSEREAFTERANRCLALLDPRVEESRKDETLTVAS
jgi:hypothetical protein